MCSEFYPKRLREYCVALCASSQWLFNFVVTQFSPHALNTLGWGIFILFAGFNFANMLGSFYLPEVCFTTTLSMLTSQTTGKTLKEMDQLFGVATAIDNQKVREEAVRSAVDQKREFDHED